LMRMGIYIHILIDTKMHEHFCAQPSWINMALRGSVQDPSGNDIRGSYPAYKNFVEKPVDEMDAFPSGLQRISWIVNETFPSLVYEYPLEPDSLGNHSMGYLFWGRRAAQNSMTYAAACADVLNFLEKCCGKAKTENWEGTDEYGLFVQNFKSMKHSFNDLRAVWHGTFSTREYRYDAEGLYKRLVIGDSSKEEKYEDLFSFLRILYDIKASQTQIQEKLIKGGGKNVD